MHVVPTTYYYHRMVSVGAVYDSDDYNIIHAAPMAITNNILVFAHSARPN